MNDNERDELWELLGRARPAKISPFFARNVLRAIRGQEAAPSGAVAWLRSRWMLAGATACVLILGGIAAWMPDDEPQAESVPMVSLDTLAERVTDSPDYAVIGNLDELLASQESSVWLTYTNTVD